jgi:hypothetical protein
MNELLQPWPYEDHVTETSQQLFTIDPERKARALDAAAQLASPTRAETRRQRARVLPLAVLAMTAVLFIWGGPNHAWERPEAVSAWIIAGFAALAITVTLLTLPRRSMLPPPASRLLTVAIGVPVVVAAWLIGWHTAYDDPFTRFGFRCFALTVAAAPWPFAALLAFMPRFDPVSPRLTGAALGGAAGAWAALLVELWCPLADPGHVLIGHALPLVFLAGLGALVGGRLLAVRRA